VSSFGDNFKAAMLPNLLNEFGESVVYKAGTVDEKTVLAIVSDARENTEYGLSGEDRVFYRDLQISTDASDTDNGITTLAKDDKITIGGAVYSVTDISPVSPGGLSRVDCYTVASTNTVREGHKKVKT